MKTAIALLSALLAAPLYAADAQPAADTAAPAAAPAAPAAPAQPTGTVARAQFTSAIENREPTDQLTSLNNDQTRVYFFTELKDMANQRATHRWEYKGEVKSEVGFDVGANRWRVFSSKTLDPSWTGEWKVTVVDANGNTLGANTFTYVVAPAPAPAAAPAAPAPAAAPAQQ
jgi:hypothetical protein